MNIASIVFFFASLLPWFVHAHSTGQTIGENKIKAVIFDCDGTLVDNAIGYYLDWQYALRRQGYELSADDFWQFMKEKGLVGAPRADEAIVQYCCQLLGRDCADELLRDMIAFSAELHAKGFPPIVPTVDFLRRLAEEKERLGLKIGIASASSKSHILRNLQRLEIESYFDIVVSGAEDLIHYNDPEGINKPKPYVYLHAAEALGLAPEECIAIEDSWAGVASAVNAGCITIAVPNDATRYHDLSRAHLRVESFAGISPSDFFKLIMSKQ
jgi:beta-phosphoglucomutase-like phosphatase (HAD superfamily)